VNILSKSYRYSPERARALRRPEPYADPLRLGSRGLGFEAWRFVSGWSEEWRVSKLFSGAREFPRIFKENPVRHYLNTRAS